jgi:hypothetical protein
MGDTMTNVKVLYDENGRVHIEFEKTDGTNKLVDCIVVSSGLYETWTQQDIDAIIEGRWLNYLDAIKPVDIEEEVNDNEGEQ